MRRVRAILAAAAIVVVAAGCTPEQFIRLQWTDRPATGDQAVAVARCESSLRPEAVSNGNYGLFQINSVHRQDFEAVTGQPWSAVLDPMWNAIYARHLWDEQGWGPWACRWAAN